MRFWIVDKEFDRMCVLVVGYGAMWTEYAERENCAKPFFYYKIGDEVDATWWFSETEINHDRLLIFEKLS